LVTICRKEGVVVSGNHKKHYTKSVYRSLVLITQFGLNMLVPICLMSILGIYLDKRFDTSFLMILGFFIGALAGGQNVFRLASKVYGNSEKSDRGATENSRKQSGK